MLEERSHVVRERQWRSDEFGLCSEVSGWNHRTVNRATIFSPLFSKKSGKRNAWLFSISAFRALLEVTES